MKKLLSIFILLTLVLYALSSCESYEDPKKQTTNEIPEQSINYTNFTFGNVIQDGKQAIFFNFVSDYTVTQIEVAGALLDIDKNVIHSFETSMTFGSPSFNPELAIRVESGLIKHVKSASFSKIKAHTTEQVDLKSTKDRTPVLKHLATANESTVENFYASGSNITTTNGKITINLNQNESSCGFRWDLSESNLKSNTKYIVKFENISATDIYNTSIQLKTTWIDSTYTWPRYYHVNGKRFDIISNGEISSDYYHFLKSKIYDEYTIEFSFTHSVESSKHKALYLDFGGVKNQLSIGKLSIYEVINE